MNINDMNIKDLAGFSEPAKVLIERVSDGLGAIFHPNQIVRIAEAENKAELIKARGQVEVNKVKILGEIEVSEVEKRAWARLAHEEGGRQQNMENILANALPELKEDARPEDIEEDWLTNFFDKCRLTSDAEMQMLWGKALAGEANEPGSFAKRTVNFIQMLDKKDAEKFQLLCRFLLVSENFAPLIYNHNDAFFAKNGLTSSDFQVLDDIGLINFGDFIAYDIQTDVTNISLSYFDTDFEIALSELDAFNFCIGTVKMTEIGRQIAKLCSTTPIEGYPDYLVNAWTNFGYKVTQSAKGSNDDGV